MVQVKVWEDSGQLLHRCFFDICEHFEFAFVPLLVIAIVRSGVEGAGEPLFDWKVLERLF